MGQDWTRTTWTDRRASPSTHAAKAFDRRGVDFLYSRNMLTRPEWQMATKFQCLARNLLRLQADLHAENKAKARPIEDAISVIRDEIGCRTFDVLAGVTYRQETVKQIAEGLVNVKWTRVVRQWVLVDERCVDQMQEVVDGPLTTLTADTIARHRIPLMLRSGLAKLAEHWEAAKLDALL